MNLVKETQKLISKQNSRDIILPKTMLLSKTTRHDLIKKNCFDLLLNIGMNLKYQKNNSYAAAMMLRSKTTRQDLIKQAMISLQGMAEI